MKWYFDASVLVAGAVKRSGYMSAHGLLVEFYSVLTRTPFKPPLYPSEAWIIIERTILPHLELVTLNAKECQQVVHRCAVAGHAGGRVYDAIHIRCAEKAGCDRVYTFNVRDFRALAPAELVGRIAAP